MTGSGPEVECWRSELPPLQCACPEHRGGSVAAADEIETVGQPFEAQYDGPCARCDHRIRAGQQIARVADQPGDYVHVRGCRS